MRNVWKGMVVGALVGAGLDLAVEAGRRGSAAGRRAGARAGALAQAAAGKVEEADIPGRSFEALEHAASTARDKLQDVAG